MRIAILGGSFDPVHSEHVRLVEAAKTDLRLDKVIIMPSHIAPHKLDGAWTSGENRLKMCELAFRDHGYADVSGYELAQSGTSYTYLTCQEFARRFPNAERFFLVGADMLENFFSWKNPREILKNVTLAVCGREGYSAELEERFFSEYGCRYEKVNYTGAEVSSTRIRTELAFGKVPLALEQKVLAYAQENNLYTHPAIMPALALEKEERREHSFRVALMATARARSAGVSEQRALIASALHDCGKYVSLNSPLLKGFVAPEGVPAPVMHQFIGAYLAEHAFGIRDGEILDAVRYHTSARENMTPLEKLIYLSDLLEEGRSYPGVERLRALFWEDLDVCLKESLREQIEYLEHSGAPVYPLTKRAYKYLIR